MTLLSKLKIFIEFISNVKDKGLIKDFLTYISGAVFLKGTAVLFIPIYTRVLTPSDYGKLELINSFSSVLIIVLSFGLPTIFFVEFVQNDRNEKIELIIKLSLIYLCISIPLYLLVFVSLKLFMINFFNFVPIYVWILVGLTSFLSFFQALYFVALQMSKKALLLTTNKLIVGGGGLLLNIILVYYLRLGIVGILTSNFLVAVLVFSVALIHFGKIGEFKLIRLKVLHTIQILKVGSSFMIGSLAYFALIVIDRWIIALTLGERDLGIYSMAFRFGSTLEPLIITPIITVYSPYIFAKFATGRFDQNLQKIFVIALLVFTSLGFCAFLIAHILVNSTFNESLPLIMPLSFGYAFFFMSQLAACYIVYMKKSNILFINILLSATFNLILNLLLIKSFKLQGAIFAFILSNFFWMLITVYQINKLKKLNVLTV